MTVVEHGAVITVDVPIAGQVVQMSFTFFDLKRMPNGDGWEASTRIPTPEGRSFRETGATADMAKERLVATVGDSPEAIAWVTREFAEGDAEDNRRRFLNRDDPSIPPE